MRTLLPRLALTLALIAGAAALRPPPLVERVDVPGAELPPGVALASVALGGLNGLLVDFLWLRAAQQQEEGDYYEMVQTASWIAALQPRVGRLHDFQAWNLAYNVSVQFPDPEDRWRWIERGLRLLLDEGLAYDPNSADVRRSLAAIVFDKVASAIDPAHTAYKRYWADEWSWILGDDEDPLAALAAAPSRPELEADVGVQALLQAARALDVELFDTVHRWTAVGAEPPEALAALLAEPAHAEALERLLLWARARRLREVWRMDPAEMAAVDREFGPFDWRAPQGYVVYWARQAAELSGGRGEDIQSERMIYQALMSAFRAGRLVYEPGGLLMPSPDIGLIDQVAREQQRVAKLFPDDPGLRAARANFEVEAILQLLLTDRVDAARRRYERLRPEFPDWPAPFERFVDEQIRPMELGNEEELRFVIQPLLQEAWLWAALGDSARSAGHERQARAAYQRFVREMGAGVVESYAAMKEAARQSALAMAREASLPADAVARLEQAAGQENSP